MIKYRPQRGSLEKSMDGYKEFDTVDDMFNYIVTHDHNKCMDIKDLAISNEPGTPDPRIGWECTQYICTKTYLGTVYDHPICIGMCDLGERRNHDRT